VKCLRCGKEILLDEAREIEKAGVEPFCSQYCSEVYSGVPLPWEGFCKFTDFFLHNSDFPEPKAL